MKVVAISNFYDDTVADVLIAVDYTEEEAKRICDLHNHAMPDDDKYYYAAKPDNYKLWRGMEDLI